MTLRASDASRTVTGPNEGVSSLVSISIVISVDSEAESVSDPVGVVGLEGD